MNAFQEGIQDAIADMISINLKDLEIIIAIGLKKGGIGEEYLDCLLAVIMREIQKIQKSENSSENGKID